MHGAGGRDYVAVMIMAERHVMLSVVAGELLPAVRDERYEMRCRVSKKIYLIESMLHDATLFLLHRPTPTSYLYHHGLVITAASSQPPL